ncbi:RNA polymerase sigma factor [Rhizosphaericola mali]|uniref:RNA polymerase sigma factor n=1 Tax=Rhizosphaericola mali TaxID=2545455 RepID=UPI00177E964A|nr:sigma-70 family RNA polymerase sigma factor [Rhizosphaericola mali]
MEKSELKDIILRCSKNDRIAQEKLYRSFFGLFYTIAKDYVADHELVTEIINQAFLKIFVNIATFDEKKGPFEGWSKRILQNVCIDIYRREKNRPFTEEISDESAQGYFNEQTHSTIFNEDMAKVFQQLPDMTRKVCQMYLVEGYPHKEIGEVLGLSESTSRWHLMEGKKKLRELLKDKYGE